MMIGKAEDKTMKELGKTLSHFSKIPFPATQIYDALKKASEESIDGKFKEWTKKMLCSFSLCKIYEAVIRDKIPIIKEKGVTYSLYSDISYNNRMYAKNSEVY